ncbi:MAG TPA: polysaccharide deacetylase family protein [Candidatus Limiplasma sp.]|nr:polysaccharide deacetylase family protein [Candidatus Limiplasma sp.]HRX08731.1 polysaccharide deacetylase family protein [Candidatus Limiplasma sp.]
MQTSARLVSCLLALLILFSMASAEPYEHPYPDELKISVKTETWASALHGDVSVNLPVTILENVNGKLRESAKSILDLVDAYTDCSVEMTATYRVSGTAWAGFLLIGRAVLPDVSQKTELYPTATAAKLFDVQTYNMNSGAPLTLYDVFGDNAEAWAMVSEAARAFLSDCYPGEARNEEALAEMVSVQALSRLAFLPGPGQLTVPFALETILPEHKQIVNLILPYPDYRPLMTVQAQEQTDNSSRPMIVLTFDDGPAGRTTINIVDALARYGATATFFCVGKQVYKFPDVVRLEAELGNTVAAHSMTHINPWTQPKDEMLAEYDTQKQLYRDVLGTEVKLMRPPGGDLKTYVIRQIGWPLIRWNKSGSDTGDNSASQIASRVIRDAAHGDIFLNHDIKTKTASALPDILKALTERGFMFATVDEMLYLNGVTPKPNVSYYDGFGIKTYPQQ